MPNPLDKNILATIIYYDGFGYPLTAFEIWKYLIRSDYFIADGRNESGIASLAEIMEKLQNENLKKYIESQNGFYFFKGRQQLVRERILNNKISVKKFDRLLKIIKWLKLIPFVKMIGVTGALAMKNAKEKSDLDLLIVLKQGKIWTGRTIITALLHIFGKRRHGLKISDRVCLNFFITDESLEIITKDLFSASEYMFLFPLYGLETYKRFQIKNRWIKSMKPNFGITEVPPLKMLGDSFFSEIFRTAGEILFSAGWIERKLKEIEKRRIMRNPKTRQEGSLIYADDDALMFLPEPRGPKIFQQFKEKIAQLSI